MAISQAMCTSFKVELLNGIHAFSTTVARGNTNADSFKLALYTSSASLGAGTTAYTTSNEVSGTGYTAAGETLTSPAVALSSTTAYIDLANATWSTSSFTANGALIYRSDGSAPTNDAVCVIAFGGDYTSTNGTFTIQFPAAAASTALLRLA